MSSSLAFHLCTEAGAFSEPRANDWVRLASQLALGITSLPPVCWDHRQAVTLNLASGDPISSLWTCKLTSESPPQDQF